MVIFETKVPGFSPITELCLNTIIYRFDIGILISLYILMRRILGVSLVWEVTYDVFLWHFERRWLYLISLSEVKKSWTSIIYFYLSRFGLFIHLIIYLETSPILLSCMAGLGHISTCLFDKSPECVCGHFRCQKCQGNNVYHLLWWLLFIVLR